MCPNTHAWKNRQKAFWFVNIFQLHLGNCTFFQGKKTHFKSTLQTVLNDVLYIYYMNVTYFQKRTNALCKNSPMYDLSVVIGGG